MSGPNAPSDRLPLALVNQVIGDFKVIDGIGRGSFGEVYFADNIKDGSRWALKMEQTDSKYPQLENEFKMMERFKGAAGFPRVLPVFKTARANVLPMSHLGDSLETLWNKCGRNFSLKTVAMIAIQVIERLEECSKLGIVHRDIKPDNILIGLEPNQQLLHLIDFGLAKQFRSDEGHIPFRNNKKLTGTPRYASLNVHHGLEHSRRDDLESLAYVLVIFAIHGGRLPWQGLRARNKDDKYQKIGQKKLVTPVETLCMGIPAQFCTFLQYARSLRFHQTPDYRYARGLFAGLLNQLNIRIDNVFDWMIPSEQRGFNCTAAFLSMMKITSLATVTPTQIAILIQNEEQARREVYRLATESSMLRRKFDYFVDRFQQQVALLRAHCVKVAPDVPIPPLDEYGFIPVAQPNAPAAAASAAAPAAAAPAAAAPAAAAPAAAAPAAAAPAATAPAVAPPVEQQPAAVVAAAAAPAPVDPVAPVAQSPVVVVENPAKRRRSH